MEIIETDEKNNQIIGTKPNMVNSKIIFNGENNRLICENNVNLVNSTLQFNGNNSIIYLSHNHHNYLIKVTTNNNCVCYIDENNYMNGILTLILSEEKHIFIGKNCLFSFQIWFRMADPHLIYNAITKERINLTKSIYVGDHVWIGQDVLMLKGTQIGSGSIIGAKSVVSNKKINSNTLWGGNPAKELKKDVFFVDYSVHKYTKKDTENSLKYESNAWIYKNEGNVLSFDEIDEYLSNTGNIDEKVKYLINIRKNQSHNRFFIGFVENKSVNNFLQKIFK